MYYTPDNVDPGTVERIQQARSLSGRPGEPPLTPYRNVGQLLAERVRERPGASWLTYYEDGRRVEHYTFERFADAAARIAAFLTNDLGIKAGERIATLAVNDPGTVIVYFGAWLIGATVVPINCGEDDERVTYILENSEARALFLHYGQAERCERLRPLLGGIRSLIQLGGTAREGFRSFDQALSETPPISALPDLSSDTECLIVYTSGTTGAPKGVSLEQYNLLADAHSIADWHRFTPDDRAMCVLPIHHVNGTVVTLMTPLYSGGSVVLNNRFSAQHFWTVLAAEHCTWVSVVPTVLAFLGERGENLSGYDLSRFRHIICGAGPLTTELAARFDARFGKRIVHGYGLSETTCYSCFLPIDLPEDEQRYWMTECGFPSIGCPITANEMAIHDAEGRRLPEDIRGEIVIRGHNVMRYYFKRPDANRDTFAHGWFRSGDEGFFKRGRDGREYYFITGRLKELIIRGGVNYSPFDIDEVLNSINGIKAGMAVGFENNFYGEEVGAYVQLEEGASLTEEEIIRSCRASLPYAKCPKVVVFGDSFPVTSTGKYQRNKLKPLFEKWKDIQFREERK